VEWSLKRKGLDKRGASLIAPERRNSGGTSRIAGTAVKDSEEERALFWCGRKKGGRLAESADQRIGFLPGGRGRGCTARRWKGTPGSSGATLEEHERGLREAPLSEGGGCS